MNDGPELLLVGAVATVGVLHTMVPDHWVPITLITRQRGWSKSRENSRKGNLRTLDTAFSLVKAGRRLLPVGVRSWHE
jgi:hypothetical protein